MTSPIYDITVTDIDGAALTLDRYRSKVMLIVNVASRCGFTPQYDGLEALYRRHVSEGFVVLGFPCNQFGGQEPGSEADIREFCAQQFDVTFPMFARIDVNGAGEHPLYRFLKTAKKGVLGSEAIKWNFTKFLVDRDGKVLARYGSSTTPEALESDVAAALARPPAAPNP